ncbi:type II secretion system protein F (GspF) [Aneurinibacillus soli]|uniref:Putative type II secretion system protein F n=1 Tax=Aneurinibacillus soli TaxID=1500254 RepID=A0A0U5B1D4_9BACL|nr:type II secretion system F family protein [Aneurinibacillus soli]PYE64131.1 type II secretion system protein F (GspF) [Aneurinibacillus soli]BAU28080.1 putative type II secretion system protein F [Aneurinibacillus soli]
MLFYYRARNEEGQELRGWVQEKSRQHLLNLLKEQGLYPTSLYQIYIPDRLFTSIRPALNSRAKIKDLIFFTEQVYFMLSTGINLYDSIRTVTRRIHSKAMKFRLESITKELEKGNSLSQSLQMHADFFPHMMISLVHAGERGGFIEQAFQECHHLFKTEKEFTSSLFSTLLYPCITACLAFLVMIFLLVFAVPQLASILTSVNVELPALTVFLLAVSDFVTKYFPVMLLVFLVAVLVFSYSYRKKMTVRMAADRFLLRVPLIGSLILKVNTARYCMTMGRLIGSGVLISQALQLCTTISKNSRLKDALKQIESEVLTGSSLSSAIETCGLFPSLLVQITEVGEKTGNIEVSYDRLAEQYMQETKNSLKRITSFLEPVVIVSIGLFVLLIAFAIFMPVMKMMNSM